MTRFVSEREKREGNILKHSQQVVGLAGVLALLVPMGLAQETHLSHDGGAWSQDARNSRTCCR